MAVGWAGDGAVQEQINATINDAVTKVRQQLPYGPSNNFCSDCGEEIPESRKKALPGVKLCLDCQKEQEEKNKKHVY